MLSLWAVEKMVEAAAVVGLLVQRQWGVARVALGSSVEEAIWGWGESWLRPGRDRPVSIMGPHL